jgi:hypothetical protein
MNVRRLCLTSAVLVATMGTVAFSAERRFYCKAFRVEFSRNAAAAFNDAPLREALPLPVDPPLHAAPSALRRGAAGAAAEPPLAPPSPPTPALRFFFGGPIAGGTSISDVDETILPYSASGELRFDGADGLPRWCSATIIDETPQAAFLITAAHCVRNRKAKNYTSLEFIRGHDLNVPTGQLFRALRAGTHRSWVSTPVNFRQYDYAIIELERPASVHLPLSTSAFSALSSLGYPKPGDAMKRDDGKIGGAANNVIEMLDNEMARGSSGGPWIGSLTEKQLSPNQVIGINAAKTSATVTIGPVLVKDVFDLLDFVKAGCPEN